MDVTGDENSEWEYEYDENETEDFYVVLELPDNSKTKPRTKADELFAAHDPTKAKKKATPKGGRKRKKGSEDDDPATAEITHQNKDNVAPATGSFQPNTSSTSNPLVQELEELNLAAAAQATSNASKGLQIMDLESHEPMIAYQGQMYGCHWATSLGSDLLFMRRPDWPGDDYRPLHAFQEVDLLAIGSARLVASHATVERKPDYLLQQGADSSTTNANLTIENEEIIRQARFFGRLADIKARKGEPVGNLKTLADSVLADPDRRTTQKEHDKRGNKARPGAPSPAPSPRRRPSVAESRPSQDADMPTIATTRSRRSSTRSVQGQAPAQLMQLDGDHEMIDAS